MNQKWQHPLLLASAALLGTAVAGAQENADDLRAFSFGGLAAGLIVLGIWIGGRGDE